jgi:nitrite reductase (NADH) small subunit
MNKTNYPNGFGSENESLDTAFQIVDEAIPPKAHLRGRLVVCAASEIGVGERRIVVDTETKVNIGVFNINGEFFAIRNICPHQGAPLCEGSVHATHRPSPVFTYRPDLAGRVLRCPWHGWEFDIVTGKGLYDATSRVATYPCEINEDGDVVVLI